MEMLTAETVIIDDLYKEVRRIEVELIVLSTLPRNSSDKAIKGVTDALGDSLRRCGDARALIQKFRGNPE